MAAGEDYVADVSATMALTRRGQARHFVPASAWDGQQVSYSSSRSDLIASTTTIPNTAFF